MHYYLCYLFASTIMFYFVFFERLIVYIERYNFYFAISQWTSRAIVEHILSHHFYIVSTQLYSVFVIFSYNIINCDKVYMFGRACNIFCSVNIGLWFFCFFFFNLRCERLHDTSNTVVVSVHPSGHCVVSVLKYKQIRRFRVRNSLL